MTQIPLLQFRLGGLMERQLHIVIPSAQADLFVTGAMDSLVFVELLMLLEREFGINIDMQKIELEDFRSLESISLFVGAQSPQTGADIPDQLQAAALL